MAGMMRSSPSDLNGWNDRILNTTLSSLALLQIKLYENADKIAVREVYLRQLFNSFFVCLHEISIGIY